MKTQIRRILAVVLAASALCAALTPLTAQAMTLREIRALVASSKQGENYVNYYLVGLMEGALEAHNHAVRAGAKPSICLNNRRLEPAMAHGLFDAELVRNPGTYEADMSAQLVMTNALKASFAC